MAHVRQRPRNIQQRLLAKIELLRQHDFVRGQHSQALLQVIEAPATASVADVSTTVSN